MRSKRSRTFVLALALLTLGAPAATAHTQQLDRETIARIVGVAATASEDGVVRVSWPRTDVAVRVDGLPMRPAMGLGTWAAFQPAGDRAHLMGDTVLFEDEVDAAIDAAFAAGLEVTALHNHFFFDRPKVYFLHIGGAGDPLALASGVRAIWDAARRVRAGANAPAAAFEGGTPEPGALDTARLEQAIGAKGVLGDGVFKITLGREAAMHDVGFGGSMGLTTWMAFAGSDDLAAVAGDFAMTGAEVQPVLRALRGGGIHVVALHNHMIGEQPPYYFTHFWGKGDSLALARALRSALDAQRTAPEKAKDRAEIELDFEAMERGRPPQGFTSARTGSGEEAVWLVSEDPTSPGQSRGLVQTRADPTRGRFPLCIYDAFEASDVELSVSFKPLAGTVDQVAGLVFRYRDAGHYYVARANALEDNVVLYKIDGGKRTDLKPSGASRRTYGREAPIPLGNWSRLRVRVQGSHFDVWLDEQHLFHVVDETFAGPGKIGVWTKADSVTAFDALRIRAL
jgi:hypothetical protein